MRGRKARDISLKMAIPFLLLLTLPVASDLALCRGNFSMPVNGEILVGFSEPTGPYGEGGHQGVDIKASLGEVVRASADGEVSWVGEVPRGKFVSITHPGSIRTVYLGLERIRVKKGEAVRKGMIIGEVSANRDDSSTATHLHFSAYVNGLPIDPQALCGGGSPQSFIRLCSPEESEDGSEPGLLSGGSSFVDNTPARDSSYLPGIKAVGSQSREGMTDSIILRLLKGAAGFFRKACSLAVTAWKSAFLPAARAVGRAFRSACKFIASNRWIKALGASILAALAIVAVIAAGVALSFVSVLVGVFASITAALGCLAGSLVYATRHPHDFAFLSCLGFSITAGSFAACLGGSLASLGGAFSLGMTKLGLTGVLKSGLSGGVFSAVFDGSWRYLTTGRIAVKYLLAAFLAGAITGMASKVVVEGVKSSQSLLKTVGRLFGKAWVGGGRSCRFPGKIAVLARGLLRMYTQSIVRVGAKIAYCCYSGSISAMVHMTVCWVNRTPVRLSGILAAFCAGVTVGMISMSFGARGLGGLLENFKIFRTHLGRWVKNLMVKISYKVIRRTVSSGYRFFFRKVLHEEEKSVTLLRLEQFSRRVEG